MKRLMAAILLGLACVVGFASPASAHVLKTDGTIGVVLHIDPDDSPVSGSPAALDLSFKDTTGKFSLPKCNCNVVVQDGSGQAVYSHSLAHTGDLTSEDDFTFPSADVYNVQVNGKPKQAGAFHPFVLNYEVRVAGGGGTATSQPFPLLLRFGLSLTIALVLLGVYKRVYSSRRNKEII